MSANISKWIVTTAREVVQVPIVGFLLVVIVSEIFHAYARFASLDLLMHCLGGVAIAFFFHRASVNASKFGILGPFHAVTHATLVFALVCTAAVFWEFAEFISDQFFGTHAQLDNEDTMSDMFLSVFGGASFLVIFALLRRRYPATPE